jgi:hypothetical protein
VRTENRNCQRISSRSRTHFESLDVDHVQTQAALDVEILQYRVDFAYGGGDLRLGGVHRQLVSQKLGEIQAAGFEELVRAFRFDLALVHQHHFVDLAQELQLVRDQNHDLVGQELADALVEQVFPHLGVHRAEGVVQEVDVGSLVHGSGEVDPGPLAPAQRNSLFPDDGLVAEGQQLEVSDQSAGPHHRVVPLLLELPPEENVLPDRTGKQPRLLRGVRHHPVNRDVSETGLHLPQDHVQEGGLPGADLADHGGQLPGLDLQRHVLQTDLVVDLGGHVDQGDLGVAALFGLLLRVALPVGTERSGVPHGRLGHQEKPFDSCYGNVGLRDLRNSVRKKESHGLSQDLVVRRDDEDFFGCDGPVSQDYGQDRQEDGESRGEHDERHDGPSDVRRGPQHDHLHPARTKAKRKSL